MAISRPSSPAPNPTKAPPLAVERLDDGSRRRDCASYAACLDVAVARGWRGFGCGRCSAFAPAPAAELAADGYKLVALALHVVRGLPANDNAKEST